MKKILFHSEKEKEGIIWTAKVISYGVSLTLMSALNEVHSARAFLLDRPGLYRHMVKKYCNMACRQAVNIESTIRNMVNDKNFWLEYSDRVIDEAERDITLFRVAIKQVLDKAKVEDSDIISRAECARVLLDVAVKQFEGTLADAREKFGMDYRKYFVEYDATGVLAAWQNMCDCLYRDSNGTDVDLNTDGVISAFDSLSTKFANGVYIDSCLDNATMWQLNKSK